MKKDNKLTVSRRQFLGTSATLLAGTALGGNSLWVPAIIKNYNKPNSRINGVQIGVITYSFRDLPDQSAEATLKYIVDAGINAVELMGDPAEMFAGRSKNPVDFRVFFPLMRAKREGTLTEEQKMKLADMEVQMAAYRKEVATWRAGASMDKFVQLKKMFADAGVQIYGFKPDAFGSGNTDAEIDFGLRAAKALGASHVTLEHPANDAHTLKLATMAKKHKVKVAYHGHEQQTPTFWDTALGQSKYNALNLDLGHYTAAGYSSDALDLLKRHHKRFASMHIKDRQTPANGKGNLPWGQGDTPIAAALQLMRDERYKFPATIELEYKIPEGSDAVKEVAKCLDYCRKVLGAVKS